MEKPQTFDCAAAKPLLDIEVCEAGPELDYHDRLSVVFFSPFKQLKDVHETMPRPLLSTFFTF
jgi:hypothetical protein